MKRLIPVMTALLLLASTTAMAQSTNLVPNGSFEQFSTCPTGLSQTTRAVGWSPFTNGTSDYFNSCGNSVPSNTFGYQLAADGNAYMGGYSRVNTTNPYKEYLTRSITAMQVGVTYEVSISVSLSNTLNLGTNDVGIFFYDDGPNFYLTSTIPPVTPQVTWASTIIGDTQNWVRLVDTFTADSTYDNIVIGGFGDINSASTTGGFSSNTYYYFDSVVVKKLEGIIINYNENIACAKDSITVLYNVINASQFAANNTFTLQLSDKSGSFNSATTLGVKTGNTSDSFRVQLPATLSEGTGYKMRVVSNSPADTFVWDNTLAIGNLDSANIIASSNSPVCEDENIVFNITHNSASATYSWSGPLSFLSTIQSPVIIISSLSQSGVYYATTTIYGCTQFDTLNITVKPKPSLPVAGSNSAVCPRDTLRLTASSTTGATYSWTGPGSYSSNTQNPSIPNVSAANSGTYTVTANLNGCVRSSNTSVAVLVAPENTVANSNTPLCVGETLNLTATNNTSGVTYSWTGPNSYSSNIQNPSITNATTAQSGAYIATYSLNGCIEKDTVIVVVNIVPATPVVSYDTPLCVGEILNLTATSTTSGVSYSWTGPNSFGSNNQNPTKSNVSISDTGTYMVTATRLNCSSSPASIKVDIRPTPFVVIFASKDTICVDESITFNSLPSNASNNLSYQWYVNAQAISGSTQTTYTSSQLKDKDVVSVRMTDNDKCQQPYIDPSNDVEMNVLPYLAPTVSITVSPQGAIPQDSLATFTATTIDAGTPTYQWKRNGQDVQGATGQIWAARTLNNNDVICVEIESGYRCPRPLTASSNCITAEVVGIDKLSNVKSLKLYPNPNTGQCVLEGKVTRAANYNIQIVNTVGQVVYTTDVATRSGSLYKSMQVNLAAGVYLLQLQETSTKQTQTMRLVIE